MTFVQLLISRTNSKGLRLIVMKKNKIYEEKKVDTFSELINSCTKQFNNKIAFTIKDKNKELHDITFIDFQENIKELGTGLINLNLNNKKIGIISPDRYEWCCSYFAIATSGNIIVPLDCLLPQNELEKLIMRSGIEAVIFDAKFQPLLEKLYSSKTTNLKYLICMDAETNSGNILSYQQLLVAGRDLLSSGDTRYDCVETDKNALSVLIYTSGTTSEPKAVMLSQYNICSNVSAMTTLIKYEENDSILVFLPLHHTLACTASFLFCYYIGFRLCFADSIKDIAKNMKEYNISGLVAVPALLDIMYRQIIKGVKKSGKYIPFKILCAISNFLMFFKIDIRRKLFKEIHANFGGHLRTIIYGSASTEKKVIKLLNTIGVDMLQGYGLTETSPVISCESDKYHNKIGSSGYPLYNEQVKLDNPDENGIGEILVKGPNIMLGYYENEEATKKAFKDGWFCTGDLGKFDKSGTLYVTGRKKDVLVLHNGKKVFPEELETILNQLDLVEESMIYAKKEKESGTEKICAKIVYSKDNPLVKDKTENDIHSEIEAKIKEINKTLPLYKYIRDFNLTTEPLIKTTTQKIKRHEEMKKILK